MTKIWLLFRRSTVAILVILTPSVVWSQSRDAQAFKIGETEVTPLLRVDYVSINNAKNSIDNQVDTTGVVVSPEVYWTADKRLLAVSASYIGNYGAFSESVLHYADHNLAFQVNATLGKRHSTSASFTFARGHEAFGTGQADSINNQQNLVLINNTALDLGYTYGADSARGNLGGGVRIATQTFSGDEVLIRGDDNSTLQSYAFFSYRVSPDTKLRTEVRFSVLDYDEDRRDRNGTAFLLGADFAPTARIGGTFRIGMSNAAYDTEGVQDTTQFVSTINAFYNLKSYSRLSLQLNRSLATVDSDDSGAGESILNRAAISWSHDWSSRVFSTARLGFDLVDRDCPSVDTSTTNLGFSVGTKVRRWLQLGAGVNFRTQDTNLCGDAQPGDDSSETEQTSLYVFARTTL